MKKVLGPALVLGALLALAAPAGAHVTVSPTEVAEGSFTKVVFRVPNESDTASTVELEVQLPEAAPFRAARTRPLPGWEATVNVEGERVTSIVWTGGAIGPGEFEEFEVSLGPVPEVDVLEFKALQTYDDGEVAAWVDPVSGDDEPDMPAPTITVTSGEGGGDGHGESAAAGPMSAAADVDPDDDAEHGTDPVAFAALLLAGVVLIGAVVAAIIASNRLPH